MLALEWRHDPESVMGLKPEAPALLEANFRLRLARERRCQCRSCTLLSSLAFPRACVRQEAPL